MVPGKREASLSPLPCGVKEAIAGAPGLIMGSHSVRFNRSRVTGYPVSMIPLRPLLVLLWSAALLPAEANGVPEPPLPGIEGNTPSSRKAFELLPPRDGGIPADEVPENLEDTELPLPEYDPILPAPEGDSLEVFQDMEAPGAPSDGEPMPEIPHIPGLMVPKFRPQLPDAPQDNSILPAEPDASPGGDLLPAPDVELATRAQWIRSPYQARRLSAEQGRPLLIFFAQIIDGPCPSAWLNDDLLTLPEFNEFAAARLVLTKLQYPPGRNFSEEKMAVLNMVREKFKIRGFPALVMLDDRGLEIKRITGYRRVKDHAGVAYSTANGMLEQLKEAEKRFSERRRYQLERVERLTSQGYRMWTSTAGTSLLAKMVRCSPQEITLMDENSAWRTVRPDQLRLFDAEWARRKQAGLLPDKPENYETPPETAATGAAAVP
jgi:thioredoxin-related protein